MAPEGLSDPEAEWLQLLPGQQPFSTLSFSRHSLLVPSALISLIQNAFLSWHACQDNFTFNGDFYRFRDYSLKPKPLQQPHPEIFQGGSSRTARDMAARVSDWYFTNGNTVEGIKAQVDDIRAKAAANGHTVKVGVNAFIIARDSEEEGRAVLQEIIDKANPEVVNAFGSEAKNASAASPGQEGNWAKSSFEDLVQYNEGFKTNLIGTPRQIAERIVALKAVGVDLILSGFLHSQEEVEYFGRHVLPLVRELEAEQRREKAVA